MSISLRVNVPKQNEVSVTITAHCICKCEKVQAKIHVSTGNLFNFPYLKQIWWVSAHELKFWYPCETRKSQVRSKISWKFPESRLGLKSSWVTWNTAFWLAHGVERGKRTTERQRPKFGQSRTSEENAGRWLARAACPTTIWIRENSASRVGYQEGLQL